MTTTSTAASGGGPGGIVLGVTEVTDLAWLLGLVEDWLLHTNDAVIGDLVAFLGPRAHGHSARPLIDALGDAGVHLTRLLAYHQQGSRP
jgi:hypothetical protein